MGNSVNIPQANSVETLVYLVEALWDEVVTVPELSREFEVRERTIHYYLELAEWLGFIEDRTAAEVVLTEDGKAFARDADLRGELYYDGVMQHTLVQTALARTDERDYEALRAAFTDVIFELDVLSEATAKRRAGAMATLVQAAVLRDDVDWKSGRMGQPTRMRRTYKSDTNADEHSDTTTWERPRDPQGLVGEARFDDLTVHIETVLEDTGPATSARIRDELAERWDIPLTDPSVFVVLRSGLEDGRWRANHHGIYSLAD